MRIGEEDGRRVGEEEGSRIGEVELRVGDLIGLVLPPDLASFLGRGEIIQWGDGGSKSACGNQMHL